VLHGVLNEQTQRYTKRIAELLKYARKKSGLSSRELAKRVGTSHSTVLAYEVARKVPGSTTLFRLIHACGYSSDFQLSPLMRGDTDYPKGVELEQVLDLAENFPARFSAKPDSADLG
jgi:transcriptional regulator with XRE-family HTH domain